MLFTTLIIVILIFIWKKNKKCSKIYT